MYLGNMVPLIVTASKDDDDFGQWSLFFLPITAGSSDNVTIRESNS